MGPESVTLGLNLAYQISVLALTAIGLAVVFGQLGVMNMAHGEFVMIGAYAAAWAQSADLPFPVGVALGFAACAVLGLGVERLLIRPLRHRPLDTLVATWGLSILIRKLVEAIFGRQYQDVLPPVAGSTWVAGAAYPSYRLVMIAVTLALIGALVVWYRRSQTGARLQAAVFNPALAAALGIDVRRLTAGAFAIGVGFAGLAGALLAPNVRVEPGMGIDYLLISFFSLIVGGPGSLTGLLSGSASIGATQVLVSNAFGPINGYVAVLILSILFMWRRPRGLFPV